MDKALIGAAVAIAIFTLTQIIIHIRDRQSLLRSRLEEIFEGINDISFCLLDIFRTVYSYDHEPDDEALNQAFRRLDKAMYRPRAPILLYFPYFMEVWEKYHIVPIREFAAMIQSRDFAAKSPSTDEIKADVDRLCITLRYTPNFLARNQEFTTQTIGFHLRRFFKRPIPLYLVGPDENEPSLKPPDN